MTAEIEQETLNREKSEEKKKQNKEKTKLN